MSLIINASRKAAQLSVAVFQKQPQLGLRTAWLMASSAPKPASLTPRAKEILDKAKENLDKAVEQTKKIIREVQSQQTLILRSKRKGKRVWVPASKSAMGGLAHGNKLSTANHWKARMNG